MSSSLAFFVPFVFALKTVIYDDTTMRGEYKPAIKDDEEEEELNLKLDDGLLRDVNKRYLSCRKDGVIIRKKGEEEREDMCCLCRVGSYVLCDVF